MVFSDPAERLVSFLIERQIMADVDVDALIKQMTPTIVDGMVRG